MSSEQGYLLLIEADRAVREPLKSELEGHGYTVAVAADHEQALATLHAEDIELVLLALGRPGLDDAAVLQSLQADQILRTLPVLLLAGDADIARVEACLDLGATDYLPVPGSPALRRRRIRACLAGRRQGQGAPEPDQAALLKLERDLELGQQIQRGFLPRTLPERPGWEIAQYYNPARAVGGDLVDVFEMAPGGPLALIIGDVCDKGVGAAIFMALFRSFLRAAGQQRYPLGWSAAPSPAAGAPASAAFQDAGTQALASAFELTNGYVLDNHGDAAYFLTVFFGVLEPATGRLLYSNGGHPPPLLVGPGGVRERLEPTGPALGIFPAAPFAVREAHLAPGEILFGYTDGVTDARDEARRFFGAERLAELVGRHPGAATALVDRVDADVSAHIGRAEQYDDITMLAVRRAPEPGSTAAGVSMTSVRQPATPASPAPLGG